MRCEIRSLYVVESRFDKMRKRCFESRADEELIVRQRQLKTALVGQGCWVARTVEEKKRSKIQEIVVCSQEEEISEHQTTERVEIKSE